MKSDHERWPFSMVQLHVLISSKKSFPKAFGPSLGLNRMWIKRNDHAPKNECVDLFYVCPRRVVLKRIQV